MAESLPRAASARPWQLPDGIDELLPDAAAQVEALRRALLDCAALWGYRLVIPPLIEYTDSLLVGVGEDLDLLTFKMPDQLSGRMLGVRADMTPQVARIDAHSLAGRGVNRLCYAGSTLHTRRRSLAASRSPLQLGAELYGEASLDADIEVADLMLTLLATAGLSIEALTLDLGHAGIYAAVLEAADLADEALAAQVFDAMQRKSRPDLDALLRGKAAAPLAALIDLHGGLDVLERARACFAGLPGVLDALDEVSALATALGARYPQLAVYIDLAELRGYRYHTGAVFAVYARGLGEALARGGRYDHVGAVYGCRRAATGFATDLRLLAAQLGAAAAPAGAIAAPPRGKPGLHERIGELRAAGEVVIGAPGGRRDPRCDRELVCSGGRWQVRALARPQQEGPAAVAAPGDAA